MSKLVSVIVPIFNREVYLENCLNSILGQTFNNLEIICVNDGSTDRSSEILNAYEKQDRRIKIINLHKNSGPGFARNVGLNQACGKYILFADSDDLLNYNTVQFLVQQIELKNVDILLYNALSFNEKAQEYNFSSTKYLPINVNYFDQKGIRNAYFNNLAYCFSPCLKIYNRTFLIDYEILFPDSIYGEDVEFWIKCLLKTDNINYIEFLGYYRRLHSDSIMMNGSIKNLKDRLENFEILLQLCIGNQRLYSFLWNIYIPCTMLKIHQYGNVELAAYSNLIFKEIKEKYRFN